ncbi:MAG: DNA/RNA nuclease SfsA [Deltaproteobacteria bacterium]|nr:MAG: DNA/RNA nuclease SfsA [Deltaproteobacteria bacterium]
MFFEGKLREAVFVERPNRFVIRVRLEERETNAYLPNPGRLHELLLPGARLILEESRGDGRKHSLTAVGVYRDSHPIMLHTGKTNDVVAHLVEEGLLPGLEGWRVKRREVTVGKSRFDLLIERTGEEMLLEVKSCTLFGGDVAMFPDAVTERGRRHLEELGAIAGETRVGVVFLIQWPFARHFLPDVHTDLLFSQTFFRLREKIDYFPVRVSWDGEMNLQGKPEPVSIPWEALEKHLEDRGAYLLVISLDEEKSITVGSLGTVRFPPGFYVYVGSAKKNLSARLNRHKRRRKKFRWHADYLLREGTIVGALPVRSPRDLECRIAADVRRISEGEIPNFGSSDCSCPSHLFSFPENPLHQRAFHEVLEKYRMGEMVKNAGG